MSIALYWTIWIALLLYCAGEAGKRGLHAGRRAAPWAWWAFSAGALLCAIHIVVAMSVAYGWDHEAAIAATARQTAAVYGLNWGGGVYANYAFVAAWLFEAWWWRRFPSQYARRSPAGVGITRAFFFVMILNAAAVFAGGTRRLLGGLIVLWLLWIWRPTRASERQGVSSTNERS